MYAVRLDKQLNKDLKKIKKHGKFHSVQSVVNSFLQKDVKRYLIRQGLKKSK